MLMYWKLLPPLIWMCAIVVVASIPGRAGPDRPSLLFLHPSLQNLLHLPEYAILSWLWCRALSWNPGRSWRPVAVSALSICAAYAACEELYQLAIPERYASWTDLTLDILGAGLGVVLFCLLRRRSRPGGDGSIHPPLESSTDDARAQPR